MKFLYLPKGIVIVYYKFLYHKNNAVAGRSWEVEGQRVEDGGGNLTEWVEKDTVYSLKIKNRGLILLFKLIKL